MISSLKEAREAAGHSLEYVADKLNIRKQYLIALEEENYDELPGKIYVKGYTKMYYELLGIDIPAKQNSDLVQTKIVNNEDGIELENKYKKYIIFCSVILLILVITFYNLLKLQEHENYATQLETINDGNNEEILDGPDQADQ